jgi:hypothetical protein
MRWIEMTTKERLEEIVEQILEPCSDFDSDKERHQRRKENRIKILSRLIETERCEAQIEEWELTTQAFYMNTDVEAHVWRGERIAELEARLAEFMPPAGGKPSKPAGLSVKGKKEGE